MTYLSFDDDMDRALRILAAVIPPTNELGKPVLLHSIRIGTQLQMNGYKRDICIAAILHDALEDTEITEEQIESAFGSEVLRIVKANTKDASIEDKMARTEEILRRCVSAGEDASIVKAADILDNYLYFARINNDERVAFFTKTSGMFLSYLPADFCDPMFEALKTTTQK